MKFNKGDKVQFIREGSLIDGVVKEFKDCSPDMWYLIDDKCKDSWIFEGHLIPLTPLAVIPQFAADWIEKKKENGDDLLVALDKNWQGMDDRVGDWFDAEEGRYELFARAWLGGYEVEKEPLYYVRLPLTYWDEDKAELEDVYRHLTWNITSDETDFSGRTDWRKADGWRTRLTEKQIKDIDEAYWGFKVPVEEVEKE
ncbi:DUF1642 domain-containing protein [Listeria monocytogenes]|uniref:DUF1642 domain-containing protein n=1 Tax=Listeria monocytogenes TaxID=1639 RepID=UPI000E6CE15F|nr:DUF1642 domain-containing protein [Listeria monocytogenes]RJB28371.1 DUF1642 domain-containing protein [Listeria monocytogenes]